MLYVALGRVTDAANLRVLAPPSPGGAVVNVVYVDVLTVGEARALSGVIPLKVGGMAEIFPYSQA